MAATLLFDLDGTICETDWAHQAAFEAVFRPLGIPMNETIFKTKVMGASNKIIGNNFFPEKSEDEQAQILAYKEAVYRDMIGDVEQVAGLDALLDWADANGIACGIVTNAPRENADLIIDGLKIRHRFKTLVCGQELARGKPDPLPYLTGLADLNGDAARSLAFEDSPSGMQAALGAGLALVGMTTNLDAPTVLGHGAGLAVKDYTNPALLDFIKQRVGRA